MNQPDQIVHDLEGILRSSEGDLGALIEHSLSHTRERAQTELNPELLRALEWPTSLPEYYEYLRRFIGGYRNRRMRRHGRAPRTRSATPRRSVTGLRTSSGWWIRRSTGRAPRLPRVPTSSVIG